MRGAPAPDALAVEGGVAPGIPFTFNQTDCRNIVSLGCSTLQSRSKIINRSASTKITANTTLTEPDYRRIYRP